MTTKVIREEKIETATTLPLEKEVAKINLTIDNDITKVELKEFHSKLYLEKLKETTYKDKKVVFILPNGKEYK